MEEEFKSIGYLYGAAMNSLNEHLSILSSFIEFFGLSLLNLSLENLNDFFYILWGYQIQGDIEGFTTNVHIGAR